MRAFVIAALAVISLPAVADARPHRAARRAEVHQQHRVSRGESLREIADHYGCSVVQLRNANDLPKQQTLVVGKKLTIPSCHGAPAPSKPRSDKAAVTTKAARSETAEPKPHSLELDDATGQSIGAPWDGSLHDPTRFTAGKGYTIRHPARVWGTRYAVGYVRQAIADVRDRFPKLHTLAIGDFSQKAGGDIDDHRSHESGRDVDIGLWFKKQPAGYPDAFANATADTLNFPATWALIDRFARTANEPGGVQVIFLDFKVQGLIYKWAKDHGVSDERLAQVFQYAHGKGELLGIVRHAANHKNHIHVRFKCPPGDDGCTN